MDEDVDLYRDTRDYCKKKSSLSISQAQIGNSVLGLGITQLCII